MSREYTRFQPRAIARNVLAHTSPIFVRENEMRTMLQVTGEMTFTANAGDVQNLLLCVSGVGQHRIAVASEFRVSVAFQTEIMPRFSRTRVSPPYSVHASACQTCFKNRLINCAATFDGSGTESLVALLWARLLIALVKYFP